MSDLPRVAKVKICGITNQRDGLAAVELGADALGFNLWPGSKRFVDIRSHSRWITQLPSSVLRVAVMVNPSREEAEAVFSLPYIDMVQFHGDEDAEFCAHFSGRPFIKAVGVRDSSSCQRLERFGARHLLLDAFAPGQFGGTGRTVDWDLAANFVRTHRELSVFISGGLKPANVAEAIAKVEPYGVDTASGVEEKPGIKDHRLMGSFIAAAKAVSLGAGASNGLLARE